MANQQENLSHIPIVLQAALVEVQTPATPTGQAVTNQELGHQTPNAVRTPTPEPTLEPRVTIAIPSSSQGRNADVSHSDQAARSGIVELITSLVNKVDTLTKSTKERFETRSGERSQNQRPITDFSPNIQRNLFGGPSTHTTQFTAEGNQNPQVFSLLNSHLYRARDPISTYNTPQFVNQAVGIHFAGPSTYHRAP
ncbi:unnamed protein product [Cochlearia groenlandica]